MTELEVAVAIAAALIGFAVVSWAIDFYRLHQNPEQKGRGPADSDVKDSAESERKSGNNDDKYSGGHESTADSTHEFAEKNASWWVILEVGPDASLNEITAAYRRKIAQYHPDKLAGLGEEFGLLAEMRAKEINNAYGTAKRLRRQ